MTKRQQMLLLYFLPLVFALFRIILVFILFYAVPNMHFKFLQFFTLIGVFVSCFAQYRLYIDGIPVVSVLVPTIVQSILSAIFYGEVLLLPTIVIFLFDIFFLFLKGVKQTVIPFTTDKDTLEFIDFDDD